MTTSELVLLFSPDPVYAAKAGEAFAALGVTMRAVVQSEVTQTIGFLADFPGQSPLPKPLVPPTLAESMMVLVGFSRERMDVLFAAMRAHGAAPCDRKAILTPTNAAWSFCALYDELGLEHEMMHNKNRGGK